MQSSESLVRFEVQSFLGGLDFGAFVVWRFEVQFRLPPSTFPRCYAFLTCEINANLPFLQLNNVNLEQELFDYIDDKMR